VADIPHFAVPFRVLGSSVAVVEQDSDEELLQSVATLLRTPVGSRDELPEYGIPDLPFRNDAGEIEQEILAAIREWEPRVEAMADAEISDLIATVEVTIG
jgi:phage baseplate assembly protein W